MREILALRVGTLVVCRSPRRKAGLTSGEEVIKHSLWIPTWERATWIIIAEILVLGLVLLITPSGIRLLLGFPVLIHLGWTTLTSLPIGEIPGPPTGMAERRRNHHLRQRVVAFLTEVQRVQRYMEEAETAGLPRVKVEATLRSAEKRILASAAEVAKVTGRSSV